jgi:hypothetical protein
MLMMTSSRRTDERSTTYGGRVRAAHPRHDALAMIRAEADQHEQPAVFASASHP